MYHTAASALDIRLHITSPVIISLTTGRLYLCPLSYLPSLLTDWKCFFRPMLAKLPLTQGCTRPQIASGTIGVNLSLPAEGRFPHSSEEENWSNKFRSLCIMQVLVLWARDQALLHTSPVQSRSGGQEERGAGILDSKFHLITRRAGKGLGVKGAYTSAC